MKFTKIFSMTVLLSVLLSTNVFAKELNSYSLTVVYNKAVFKGNGTPEGNAFAKKCNELEQKRVDKAIEDEKYSLEHSGMINDDNPKILAHARKLHQEVGVLSKKMVKEGCFKK